MLLSLLAVAAAFLSASCAGSPRPQAPETKASNVRLLLETYPPASPFPNSNFLEVGGNRLHYLTWLPSEGVKTKGKVLLVHGFAASVYCWRFLGPALAGLGYQTVAVDHPPFGWSEPSAAELAGKGSGSPESRARLLWSFLDALDASAPAGERGPWVLVGHSLGGRIAAWMASRRPEMTKALVLLAPAVAGEMGPPGLGGTKLVQGWLKGNLQAVIHDESLVRSALAKAYGRKPSDEELAGYWAPLLREGAIPALSAWAREGVEKDLPDFAGLRVRTLVLWGTKDGIVRSAGRDVVLSIPGSLLVSIADGSHCLMETQFAETREAIDGFLEPLACDPQEGGGPAGESAYRP